MKIKNYLLTVLFPIFMIFAFSPIALAQNAEAEAETEIETKAKTAEITCEEKSGDAVEKSEKDLVTTNKAVKNENTAPITSEKNSDAEKTEKSEEKSEKTTQKSDNTAVKSEGVQTAGEVSGETAEPEQKSSSYTVEFTHKDLQYVLPGGTSVKLSKILDKLEIKGSKITEVTCSNDNLFSATKESGEWVINSHKPFHTDEHLYVTIDNIKYDVKVTDSPPSGWQDNDSYSWKTSSSLGGNDIRAIYYHSGSNAGLLTFTGSGIVDDVSESNSILTKTFDGTKSGNILSYYSVRHIELPNGISYIGKNMFCGVNRTGSGTVKNGFTVHFNYDINDIGEYAFEGSGINCAFFPGYEGMVEDGYITRMGLFRIRSSAFLNCPVLNDVYLPITLSGIETNAFKGTPNGMNIYVNENLGSLNDICGSDVSSRFNNYLNQYFHWHGIQLGNTVCAFAKCELEPASHPGNYNKAINNSERIHLEILGYGAMYDFTTSPIKANAPQINTITFNTDFGNANVDLYDKNFTSIGEYAFYQCSNVTSVTLPADLSSSSSLGYRLTNIGKGAFEQCTSLSSIKPSNATSGPNTFPSGVTTLNESVLKSCTRLASFTIPTSVITIDNNAFYGDTALTSITIPAAVTTIGYQAFHGCTGLTSVTINESTSGQSIGYAAFRNCTSLTSINIPKSVTQIYGVDASNIHLGAFSGCTALTSITFTGGRAWNLVLGAGAFYNTRATSITLPEKLTVIGPGAFQANTNLTTINIPSTVTTINTQAFYQDTALTSITIPTSVTTMSTNAFAGLANAADIYYDGTETDFTSKCATSVTNVFGYDIESTAANSYIYHFKCGDNLWYAVDGANSKISINEGSGAIWSYNWDTNLSPFNSHCQLNSAFTSIEMTAGSSIGSYAFYQCVSVQNIIVPIGLTSVGNGAFMQSGLTNITIPSSVTTIGDGAFQGCSALATVNFEGNTTTTPYSNNITSIGQNAFQGLTANADIWYSYGKKESLISRCYDGATLDSSFGSGNTYIYHLAIGEGQCGPALYWDVMQTYQYVDGTNDVDETKMSVTGSGAFYTTYTNTNRPWTNNADGENTITKVTISGATNIAQPIFRKLTALTTVVFLDNNITEIQWDAFWGCTSLATLTVQGNSNTNPLPSSLTTIGPGAFGGCTSLTSIRIPASVTTIQDASQDKWGTFTNCTNLATITFEGTPAITNVGRGAFYGCTSISSVSIPTSVTTIGQAAFYGCTGLTNVTLPPKASTTLTSIGTSAFQSCTSLATIRPSNESSVNTFPAGVTTIGQKAFYGDAALTGITIPTNVTTIGTSAFQGCSALATVNFEGNTTATPYSNNITSIGQNAFQSLTVNADIWYRYGNKASLISKCYDGTTLDSSFGTGNTYIYHFIKSEGQCGPTLYWKVAYEYPNEASQGIDSTSPETQTMYVTGSGDFYTTYTNNNRPWTNNVDGENNITKAVITKTDAHGSDITNIGDAIFRKLYALTTVEMPNTITEIRHDAFWQCTALANITLPSSLEIIGPGAFNGCAFTSVSIPASVTEISDPTNTSRPNWGGFAGCTNLTSVTFEGTPSIETIGVGAFYGCSSLTGITIPTSITSAGMHKNAFSGLANAADIYYAGTEADFISKCTTSVETVFGHDIESTAANSYIYHFLCGDTLWYSIDGYTKHTDITGTGEMWTYWYTSNPSDNAQYGLSPFNQHASIIATVTIDSGATTIGTYAFFQCASITDIVLPSNGLTAIGKGAFEKCLALASIKPSGSSVNTFPSSITPMNMSESVLNDCGSLATFVIPANTQSIGRYAFRNCGLISNITIPTTVTTIGQNAFVGVGTDNSISQVDIYYNGKESVLKPKCYGGTALTGSFGCEAINEGKYAFHFTQDITYYEADGSAIIGSPTSYQTASGNTINLYEPQDASKQFAGWCTDQALSTEPIKSFTAAKNTPYGDLVYYAKWITERTIFYIVNGGTALANGSFRPLSGDTVVLDTTTKSGNAFLGWHFEEDLSDASIGSFVADENHSDDVTVYAEWYERENISYWANSSQTLHSTTEYEIIKPWETTLQGGTGQSPKWYVLNSDVTFDKRLIVNGNVNLILQDGCNLVVNKGISVNNPNSIAIYAQDSDYNYINQDLGNIIKMRLMSVDYKYNYNGTTYGTGDYDDGPIVDLTNKKLYNLTARGEYCYDDESGTGLIVDNDSWEEEGEGSGVWYCIPEGETEKYYEGEEGGRYYIATAEGTPKYYINGDYTKKWSNVQDSGDTLWIHDNEWYPSGESQSYFFDTIGLKSYYEDYDSDREVVYYYETTDTAKTHKYYRINQGNFVSYFTDDWDTYNNPKEAGKIESDPSREGAGIGGDEGNINGDITIYGGEYKLYGGFGNAGIGTGAFVSGSNANNHTITINGGTFDIDARYNGGTAIGGGNYANGGNIVINGGRMTLDCQEDGVACIGAGNGVTTNTTQISLSWTNITDYIKIKKHNINYSTLTIDSNKPFVFLGEDKITSNSYATAETITGKGNSEFTIIPYPNTSYVLTIPKTTTLPFKTTKYKFKSDSSDDTKPSVSVYTRPDDETTPTIDESTPLVKPYQIVLTIAKTNFVKDGDATKTIVYDLVDKTDTSLVDKDGYFASDSYDYGAYRETHIGGAQDVWMSIDSSVWENLSPGIYRATVTFNVGLATNGTSSGGGGPTYIDPGSGSMS